MQSQAKTIVRNLVILCFGALPTAVAVVWIQMAVAPLEWMQETEGAQSVTDIVFGLVFWVLVLIVPVVIGGALHQLVLYFVRPSWTPVHQRVGVLLSTPVVLTGFLLIGNSPEALLVPRVVLPVTIGLLLYGLLARPLRGRGDGET